MTAEIAERRLRRLAEACRTRNVDKDWPALKPLIDEALGLVEAPNHDLAIPDIHTRDAEHTKRLEEYATENAALRDRIKGEHLAWLAKKEYEDRIAAAQARADAAEATIADYHKTRIRKQTAREVEWERRATEAALGIASMVAQLREIITDQANDEGLWFDADRAPEAYLQRSLRDLHGVVERAITGLEDKPGVVLDRKQDKPELDASPATATKEATDADCKCCNDDCDCGCLDRCPARFLRSHSYAIKGDPYGSLDSHKEPK